MRCLLLAIVVLLAGASPLQAQLRGHGGPVRAVAVSPDGGFAVSGSFDSAAIRWSLTENAARGVLRFHESSVNAVAFLPDGRLATGGEDGKIALWQPGQPEPVTVFEGHRAPIASLAISKDGATLASASWDRTVRLWPLAGGEARVLEGHSQNVNSVAFTPDGNSVISAGYDATLRIWPLNGQSAHELSLPSPLNAVAVAPDGEIVAAGADGQIFFLSADGGLRAQMEAAPTPIISLALSPDGQLVAAAGVRGSVSILARKERRLERTLVGPGLPVWSVAFLPDNRRLLSGGADRLVRLWDATTGEPIGPATTDNDRVDPLAAYGDDPGAMVYRACIACHTLSADQGPRAGPTLAGIFGRRIASLSGYNFSPALKQLDIVWTPETVSKLFEIGPAAYTPGTKMPEQVIGSAQDRAALVEFLKKATTSPR